MSGPAGHGYSLVADEQLDEIEAAAPDLYNDIVEICEEILDHPEAHRAGATAITTRDGVRMRTAVPGRPPYKIFWSAGGPRIEAVFPYRA